MSDVQGKTISEVRQMTDAELQAEGWDGRVAHAAPTVLVLEDGTKLYPSRDPEGNGPGSLFGKASDGQLFGFTHGGGD